MKADTTRLTGTGGLSPNQLARSRQSGDGTLRPRRCTCGPCSDPDEVEWFLPMLPAMLAHQGRATSYATCAVAGHGCGTEYPTSNFRSGNNASARSPSPAPLFFRSKVLRRGHFGWRRFGRLGSGRPDRSRRAGYQLLYPTGSSQPAGDRLTRPPCRPLLSPR